MDAFQRPLQLNFDNGRDLEARHLLLLDDLDKEGGDDEHDCKHHHHHHKEEIEQVGYNQGTVFGGILTLLLVLILGSYFTVSVFGILANRRYTFLWQNQFFTEQ